MEIKHVTTDGLARLPAFCHATVAGDFIFVSGTLGTAPHSMELVFGGTGPETVQALRNIEAVLRECGASLADVVKASVYLRDIQTFPEMNQAYVSIMGESVPARITVGGAQLALGAAVEIDCIAYKRRAADES